jgi:hypothetical protein
VITREEFISNFDGHDPPEELLRLWELNRSIGPVYYSEGFELVDDDKGLLKTWSESPEFLDRLLPFAQADGAGSRYALWIAEEGRSLSSVPVVLFESEGATQVVASSVREFLQVLSVDVEPIAIGGPVGYERDEDEPTSEGRPAYVDWLSSEYGLEAILDAESIVSSAQAAWQSRFEEWLGQFTEAFDRQKVEEVVMALLTLTMSTEEGAVSASKNHATDVLDSLAARGWLRDPQGKGSSVTLTEEGEAKARELFDEHFGK